MVKFATSIPQSFHLYNEDSNIHFIGRLQGLKESMYAKTQAQVRSTEMLVLFLLLQVFFVNA